MLKLVSSMATRQVLAELAAMWRELSGVDVVIESVGGVDAARRVRAGEAFDGVVLASDAIDKLLAGGHGVPGSRIDLLGSSVAVAVKAGEARPDISTESLLRRAIEAAPAIGYSTGPSGVALLRLFEQWGMTASLQSRLIQAPPGVPVGTLIAQGDVSLGFQQLSELLPLQGVAVLGTLPEPVSITTLFSAAVCASSAQAQTLGRLLGFMASREADSVIRRHGMEPAAR